jgi:hypothetical protein
LKKTVSGWNSRFACRQPDFHRSIQFGENRARAGGKGVDLLLRQVSADFDCAGDNVEREQDGRHDQDAGGRVENRFVAFFFIAFS